MLGIPFNFRLSSLLPHSFHPVRNARKINPDRGAEESYEFMRKVCELESGTKLYIGGVIDYHF